MPISSNGGLVRHSKAQFRMPPFAGDVTYIDGEVIAKEAESAFGAPLVTVKLRMTNQDGGVLLDGTAEVELLFRVGGPPGMPDEGESATPPAAEAFPTEPNKGS